MKLTIDWEERRYEIAKSVIGHIKRDTPYEMADAAVAIANALIEKLKETK